VIYDDGVTLLDTWGALESLVDEGRSKAVYGVGLKSFRWGPKHLISLWKLNYQIPGHLTSQQFRINQRNQRSSRLVSVAVGGSWWGY